MATFAKFDTEDTDPKVPTWDGKDGALGLERYEREAYGYEAGMKDDDLPLCGPGLWRNLRKEAKMAVQDLDPKSLRAKVTEYSMQDLPPIPEGADEDEGLLAGVDPEDEDEREAWLAKKIEIEKDPVMKRGY